MVDYRSVSARRVRYLSDLLAILRPQSQDVQPDLEISGFAIDSRAVRKGQVFVAIPGTRVDGHDYVEEAFRKGACACLVSSLEKLNRSKNCILVEDTVQALGLLAAAHRRSLPVKVAALTGSVGKTTTKEILYGLLSLCYQTQKSEGNFNSTIGLPLQILKLTEKDQWMVAEMGMSYAGEIRALTQIVQPDIAIWLSVQAVHMANFEGIEAVAKAKAEMVEELGPDRFLVHSLDDAWVRKYSQKFSGKRFTYSMLNPRSHVHAWVEPFSSWEGSGFTLKVADKKAVKLYVPLIGRHNIKNALAACTAALVAGIPLSELKHGLKRICPANGRSVLQEFSNRDILLLDDCYNANPYAVTQVLRAFAALPTGFFRWFIFGDMLELGSKEILIHQQLGKMLAGYGFDRITLVGTLSKYTFETLCHLKPESCSIEHFSDSKTAAARINKEVPDHTRIWCKASRSIALEHVVRSLDLHFRGERAL